MKTKNRTKARLSKNEHLILGDICKTTRETLMAFYTLASEVYGKSSCEARFIDQSLDKFELFRSELDNDAALIVKDDQFFGLYYGPPMERKGALSSKIGEIVDAKRKKKSEKHLTKQ